MGFNGKIPSPAIDRLLRRIVETEGGCWVFTGAMGAGGYGVIGRGGRADGNAFTHRVAYEYFVAEIPPGLDLDHLCRNRACCNPWHLEPVSRKENVARGSRRPGYALETRTHCKWGHEFTPENTATTPKQRICLACRRQNYAARRAAA